MTGIGIYEGDTLLVDRSIDPRHNAIVLAALNNEFTVKRLYRRGGVVKLVSENPIYPAKLRAQQSHASMLQVFLRTNRFRPELPQYHPHP